MGCVILAFGKRKPAKKSVDVAIDKPISKSIENNELKNKISKFNKKIKVKSYNDFGLPKQERLELFIKNKIKSSRRYNGWYISINTFNFAEKIDFTTDIIYIADLVDKIHKNKV